MNLYTKLSTLSTFVHVDSSVYIPEEKNDCFVKYVEYRVFMPQLISICGPVHKKAAHGIFHVLLLL